MLQNRDIIKLFERLRVSDSFLLQTNIREILFRKPAYLASTLGPAPGGGPSMSRPIIALLTDFGTADHYAGTMKGVVLGLCPDATLVDISHDIPPHDVMTASIELAACYKYFPAGHDLPRRRGSRRGVGAPRPGGRGG